jgi:hypothetical protein
MEVNIIHVMQRSYPTLKELDAVANSWKPPTPLHLTVRRSPEPPLFKATNGFWCELR